MSVKKSIESTEMNSTQECPQALWFGYGQMGRKLICTLLGILLVYSVVFVGTLIRNNLKKYHTIGRADRTERTITVEADGKVTVTPDVALTTMGMSAEAKTVAEAQKKNTEVMNKLLEKLSVLAVDKKDVQTINYNIYPTYDYKDGTQVIRGYQVDQSVTIKIRNLTKANDVIALAGEVGANNVSGLQFTVDDREVYKAKARDMALKKVAQKRAALARSLGVRLSNIVSYNEYDGAGNVYGDYGKGGMTPMQVTTGPILEPGTNEISIHVGVTFEVQQ